MEPFRLFIRGARLSWDDIAPGSYLRRIPALAELPALDFHQPVTFFVGENGSGKSTLLEALAIAAGFNPEGGTRNYNFSTYDSHAELAGAVRLIKGVLRPRHGYFLRAESFYNVATQEIDYEGDEQLHCRSHGESFLYIAQHHFVPQGLYFLDEPEAALSPQRQLALLCEIDRCVQGGAQFLVATHSPILLSFPGAEILSFDGGPICPCAYEDTESYRITKMFLESREQLLHQLLGR